MRDAPLAAYRFLDNTDLKRLARSRIDTRAETHAGPRYRNLHSSGELLLSDRLMALSYLASLPGAKLFVL